MSLPDAASRAAASFRTPKTILGFFAIVIGILFTSGVFVVGILARTPELRSLVTPVLLFAAGLVIVVLAGVFITAWKDPTILMLGQVTGEVYIENRKLTLGDSETGDFTENFLIPQLKPPGSPPLLPSQEVHVDEQNRESQE